ncbi:MAG TPA: response regulator [Thermoanaerobaculia bacterium]
MSTSAAPARRVLIVEDDEALRDALCEALRDEGFSVASAADGIEALDLLGGPASPRPSVILLDLTMPRMNGWQFRAAQRTDARISAIPVVVLSAAPNLAEEAESLGVPSGNWLRKPVRLVTLLAIVARHCAAAG